MLLNAFWNDGTHRLGSFTQICDGSRVAIVLRALTKTSLFRMHSQRRVVNSKTIMTA